MNVLALTFDYGLSNPLGLSLSLPYLWHDATHRSGPDDYHRVHEHGWSDAVLSGRYSWRWEIFGKSTIMTLASGLTLPLSDRTVDILSDHVDFTTGTIDPVFGLTGMYGLNQKTVLRLGGFTRQVWSKTVRDQKIGSYYSYTLSVRRLLAGGLHSVQAGFLAEVREQYRVAGRGYRNSGGEWYFATGGLSWTLFTTEKTGIRVSADLEIPLAIRVNGTQPVQGTNVRLGLVGGISL